LRNSACYTLFNPFHTPFSLSTKILFVHEMLYKRAQDFAQRSKIEALIQLNHPFAHTRRKPQTENKSQQTNQNFGSLFWGIRGFGHTHTYIYTTYICVCMPNPPPRKPATCNKEKKTENVLEKFFENLKKITIENVWKEHRRSDAI